MTESPQVEPSTVDTGQHKMSASEEGDMLLNDYADQSTLRGALHPLFSLLAVVCFMLAVTLPAFGEVYTWADADGIVHYSSVPPEKSKSKVKRMESRELAVSRQGTRAHTKCCAAVRGASDAGAGRQGRRIAASG